MLSNESIEPVLRIIADFNHDGLLDEHKSEEEPSSGFAIVLPVSHVPENLEDWVVMGEVHPLDTGTVKVRLNSHTLSVSRLSVRAEDRWRDRVMLFVCRTGNWSNLGLDGQWVLPWDEYAQDFEVTLGIVVRAPSRDISTNGILLPEDSLTLGVTVFDRDDLPLDASSIRLVVCPFLLTSALDPVEEVLIVENNLTQPVIRQLRHIVAQAGAQLRTICFDESVDNDLWVQDTVEFGRFCLPSPGGKAQAVGVLTGIRTPHEDINCELLDRNIRAFFGQSQAVLLDVATPRADVGWIDWYGNLEVSPPVRLKNGHTFPYGRVLVGQQKDKDRGLHPDVLAFLEAQRYQTPAIVVDTSWLLIGHVDEVVNFVPAPDPPGFRVLIPSPYLATTILETLVNDGQGDVKVFANRGVGELMVTQLLEGIAYSSENAKIQRSLRNIQDQLCEELGVEIDDFIQIPALFREGCAVIPNGVNCLVCNRHVVFPDPVGPIVDGQDVFLTPTRTAFMNLGLEMHTVDIWEPYHVWGGEIHCGTNTVRRVRSSDWWRFGSDKHGY